MNRRFNELDLVTTEFFTSLVKTMSQMETNSKEVTSAQQIRKALRSLKPLLSRLELNEAVPRLHRVIGQWTKLQTQLASQSPGLPIPAAVLAGVLDPRPVAAQPLVETTQRHRQPSPINVGASTSAAQFVRPTARAAHKAVHPARTEKPAPSQQSDGRFRDEVESQRGRHRAQHKGSHAERRSRDRSRGQRHRVTGPNQSWHQLVDEIERKRRRKEKYEGKEGAEQQQHSLQDRGPGNGTIVVLIQ